MGSIRDLISTNQRCSSKRNFLFENNGFSLMESMLALSMIAALVILSEKSLKLNKVSVNKKYAQLNLLVAQQNILKILKNKNAWVNTINDPANVSLACLRTGASCVGKQGAFQLRTVDNQLFANTLAANVGFNIAGKPCSTYPTDPACPIRIDLTWKALCSEGVCIQAKIDVNVNIANNSNDLLGINAQSFSTSQHRDITPISASDCSNPSLTDPVAIGSGTDGDPYLLCTPYQVNNIGKNPQLLDKVFKLFQDIDMSMIPGNHNPIGGSAAPFTGKFDGSNRTISNFKNVSIDQVMIGLFARTSFAEIYDLTLADVRVRGKYYVGGLIGSAENTSINDVHLTGNQGSVAGERGIGGLVGYADKLTVNLVSSSVSVMSGFVYMMGQVGGIVGVGQPSMGSNQLTISNATVTGDVIVKNLGVNDGSALYIGGLVGSADNAAISDSNFRGHVKIEIGSNGFQVSNIGGIIGQLSQGNLLRNSVSPADLNPPIFLDLNTNSLTIGSLGGLVGSVFTVSKGQASDNSVVGTLEINTVSSGTNINHIGGLFGLVGEIDTSNNTANNTPILLNINANGLTYLNIGGGVGGVRDWYGGSNSQHSGDITLSATSNGTVFQNIGGFFGHLSIPTQSSVGTISNHSASGNIFFTGSANAIDAQSFGGFVGRISFGQNIDATPFKIESSTTDVNILFATNGSGNLIKHLGGFVGLAEGPIPTGATYPVIIERSKALGNVGLDLIANGVDIQNLGGFVGYGQATDISQSFSVGQISSAANGNAIVATGVGGFAGQLRDKSRVKNSYSVSTIKAVGDGSSFSTQVGGFVGYIQTGDVSIEHSYSAGFINIVDANPGSTTSVVGGFVGKKEGNPQFTTCKWDIEAPDFLNLPTFGADPEPPAVQIIPRTNGEMKTRVTYTDPPGTVWDMDTAPISTNPISIWLPPDPITPNLPTLRNL